MTRKPSAPAEPEAAPAGCCALIEVLANRDRQIISRDRTITRMAHQIRGLQKRLGAAGLDARLPPTPKMR